MGIAYLPWPAQAEVTICGFFKAAKIWVVIDKTCSLNNEKFLDIEGFFLPLCMITLFSRLQTMGFCFYCTSGKTTPELSNAFKARKSMKF